MNYVEGEWIRYETKLQFIDDEGKLTYSIDRKETSFGQIQEVTHNLIKVNDTWINQYDILKSSKTLYGIIEKGDAYYYMKNKKKITQPKMINRDTDFYEFKNTHDLYVKQGAVLYLVAHNNIVYKNIRI